MIGKQSRQCLAAAAVAVAFACAFTGTAAEHTAAADDPYMKTAVARTRVEMTFRDAESVFDPDANGCRAAWAAAEKAKSRIDQLLTTAAEREQDRGETRDEGFIAACEQRLNRLEELWTALDEQTRPTLDSRLDKVTAKYEAARNVLASLIEQEPDWKKAGIDLAALQTAYAALEKRLTELVSEAEPVIKGVKAKQTELENELKAAEKFLAERDAEKKPATVEPGAAPTPAATERPEETK